MSSSLDPRGPDATVADLASAAVLGAVLWDPRRVHDVMDWLEPADFLHPVHRAIYTTVLGLVAAGEPVDLLRLPAVLASGRFHDVHVDRSQPGPLGAAALHTLLSFTPATPRAGYADVVVAGHPQLDYGLEPHSEHVRYAQLVLEASVRRQVHAAGVRIAQHAREAIEAIGETPTPRAYATPADAAEKLEALLDTIERHLQHLAARLDRLDRPHGTDPGAPAPEVSTAPERHTRPAVATGRACVELDRAERAVIGACLVSADVRRTALAMLTAADFLTPQVAVTWTALTTLAARGEPVDFVLLAAAVERQATTAGRGHGLTPAELFRLSERGDLLLGNRAVQTVARASLRRAMATAHYQITAAAADPTLAAGHVVRDARDSLARAHATVRRLLGEPGTAPARPRSPSPPEAPPITTTASRTRSVRPSPPITPVPVPAHRHR